MAKLDFWDLSWKNPELERRFSTGIPSPERKQSLSLPSKRKTY
jgi:hypothetical protein